MEREKKEQVAKREYEGRLIKQLLEERRQLQDSVGKSKKQKECDTARIIKQLEATTQNSAEGRDQ